MRLYQNTENAMKVNPDRKSGVEHRRRLAVNTVKLLTMHPSRPQTKIIYIWGRLGCIYNKCLVLIWILSVQSRQSHVVWAAQVFHIFERSLQSHHQSTEFWPNKVLRDKRMPAKWEPTAFKKLRVIPLRVVLNLFIIIIIIIILIISAHKMRWCH